jgi:exodeoxyribonuclease-1
MFGTERFNTALIVPLAMHPDNHNEVICFDLDADPAALRELTPEQLRERLFARRDELAPGQQRPGLKTVHTNRCPVLVPAKMADPALAARIGLDGARCRRHLAWLRQWQEQDSAAMTSRVQSVYQGRSFPPVTDPDCMLYSGGFFSDQDRRTLDAVRAADPQTLAQQSFAFADARLPEMLFRYRARNYPETLTAAERAQWDEFRFQRITEDDAGGSICLDAYQALIETLLQGNLPQSRRQLLQELLDYGDTLMT